MPRPLIAGLAGSCLGLAVALMLAATPASPGPPGPIKVGGTLALTGPLGSTAVVHKLAAEIYVEQLNRRGGLLGRQVEYILLDDQSKPDLTRALYERLVTVDKVDLIIGAHATGANLSAMSVAKRYGKLFLASTMIIDPRRPSYEMYFPTQAMGPEPYRTFAEKVFDALAATGRPPKTVAVVGSKFPSVHFITLGAKEVLQKRGLIIALDLEYEFGNRDFGAIAARVKDASADFLWVGGLGVDGVLLAEALRKLDYTPRGQLTLFPAPAPMTQSPDTKHALAMSVFEEHPPFTDNPVAAEFVKLYRERATRAGLTYTQVDHQAALGYAIWEILEAAVAGTRSLDDRMLAQWLKANPVNTIIGRQRFACLNNSTCDDLFKVKQVQHGRWVTVWPKEWAAPGAKIVYPSP
jgi:branched-chain amino acid transport system substrate-binding protein